MQKKVREFMEQHHMAEEGERILAAVSGGADSICLLMVLSALQKEKKYELFVVHVEHGIRGEESEKDAEFVRNFCEMHKIPCKVYHCKAEEYAREHKMTVEEGARTLRYGFFKKAAQEFGADKIAVAHNRNDCAETVLFHLARGTGLKGLCGILPVRENIIRPLLCLERSEIEAFLEEKGQSYCVDKTNEELDYTRNRIRHQVLPVLSEINSQAVFHINQTAAMAAELEELVQQLVAEAEKQHLRREESGVLVWHSIQEEKPLIRKGMIHGILTEQAGSSQDISNVHITEVLELFTKQVGKKVNLPYGLAAERTYEGVRIGKANGNSPEKKIEKEWELIPGETLEIPEHGYRILTRILEKTSENEEIPQKMYTKWLDYDKIKGGMLIRTRREKDYFIINARGETKKLKKYLIEEKIPAGQRDKLLLLADEVHLIWAIGYRIGEDVKVTRHTKRILEIQVEGGNICE